MNPSKIAADLQFAMVTVRTRFLLQWIEDDTLRRVVHKCTTKIERHHRFAKYLAFGLEGLLRTNDPADQEKGIVYNELVANAVALQNVVDQTQVLHGFKIRRGADRPRRSRVPQPLHDEPPETFRRLSDKPQTRTCATHPGFASFTSLPGRCLFVTDPRQMIRGGAPFPGHPDRVT
jgi:hypothetical protein